MLSNDKTFAAKKYVLIYYIREREIGSQSMTLRPRQVISAPYVLGLRKYARVYGSSR